MKKDLGWMFRPFAHRGLHDSTNGIIENSRSAIRAAMQHDYGVEVDLRPAACGTVMVFHDDSLERLTTSTGWLRDMTKQQLQMVPFKGTSDKMLTLHELLAMVDGRIPMLLEVKSDWSDDKASVRNFVKQIISTLQGYNGPFAVMSFDPAYISAFRQLSPELPRGLISEQYLNLTYWHHLTWFERLSRRFLLSFLRTRPDFIAYNIHALPALAPMIARRLFRRPLLTWTVRTKIQQQHAKKVCDAIIFEALHPTTHQGKTSP